MARELASKRELDTLLDEDAAAHHVGMSRWFLRRARTRGTGPAYHKIGRAVRYAANDLDAWLDRQRVAATDDESSV